MKNVGGGRSHQPSSIININSVINFMKGQNQTSGKTEDRIVILSVCRMKKNYGVHFKESPHGGRVKPSQRRTTFKFGADT